jgi:hypothetical protein
VTWGQPLISGPKTPAAIIPTMGPSLAMKEVLAAYLRCAVFRAWGDQDLDREFQLVSVELEWPDAGRPLVSPMAAITEVDDTFHLAANMTPTPLESTLGTYDCLIGRAGADPPATVLWRTAEADETYQVDFWTTNKPDRQGIEARLSNLFNPGQDRSGVLLSGHPRYYERIVRATLISTRMVDTEDAVYPNEWRLMAMVKCQIPVVDLRLATLLDPKVTTDVAYADIDTEGDPP